MSAPSDGSGPAGPMPTFGRYEVIERIGEGGMAEVFRVRVRGPLGFEKRLVLKRLLAHLSADARVVAQLAHEAAIAAQLRHANIVQVFDLEAIDSGGLGIVMEDIEGVNLQVLFEAATGRGLQLPSWFAIHVVSEVLSGLVYAHESPLVVVHRDVSPSNIFLSWSGEVKLADFGIAKPLQARGASLPYARTESGARKGKTAYLSPEQVATKPVDPRSDLFAVGTVLWELLTGRRLFDARSDYATMLAIAEGVHLPPSEFVPTIPPELDAVVLRALAVDPADRWPSARTLRGALLELRGHLRPFFAPDDVEHVVSSVMGRRDVSERWGLDRPMESRFRGLARGPDTPPRFVPSSRASADLQSVPPAPSSRPSLAVDPRGAGTAVLDTAPSALRPAADSGDAPSGVPTSGSHLLTPMIPVSVPVAAGPPPFPPHGNSSSRRDLPSRGPPEPPVAPARSGLVRAGAGAQAPGPASSWDRPMRASNARPSSPAEGEDAIRSWGGELTPSSRSRVLGFYATSDRGERVGPVPLVELPRWLQDPRVAELSIDGVWSRGAREVAAALGLVEPDGAELQLRNVASVGSIEPRGVVHVLGRLAAARATGRFVVLGPREKMFLDLVNGAPVMLSPPTGASDLMTWIQATAQASPDEAQTLGLEAVRGGHEAVMAFLHARPRFWGRLGVERLHGLLRVPSGRFAFGQPLAGLDPAGRPFAPSILHRLHEHLVRTHMAGELWAALSPRGDRGATPTARWNEVVDALALRHDEMIWASRLAQGTSPSELARTARDDEATIAALTWVLLESEAMTHTR